MFRTARRLKGHQQQQGSARKQQGSARKQQGSARKQQQQQQQHQRPAMTGVWRTFEVFCAGFFGVLLSGGVLGAMGAAPGSICPVFFPFSPFFPSGGVASAASGPVCPRFFSLFFPRSGVRRTRPDSPSFFFLVFSTSGGVASAASGPVCPCFFSLFFHVRRSAGGRTRPGLPLFFPFFSTSGGGRIRPDLPSFFPFFPRQVEWDGAGSSAGWAVSQETAR